MLPQLAGLLLEPPLYLLADRHPRKRFVVIGLAAFGACQALAGLSWSAWVLAFALALAAPADGVGVNLAQACLVDARPAERERIMARWSLAGTLGDLVAPVLLALLAALGHGWRAAFLITAAASLAYAALLALAPFPSRHPPDPEGETAPPASLRAALGNPRLLRWLAGVWMCGLLDELLVAFAALRLERLGAGIGVRSLAIAGFTAGAVAGLALTERLLRRVEPLRLLRRAGLAGAAAYFAWLAAPGVAPSFVLLPIVGLCAAPLYPIAQAQAYRALPGRSGMVNAAAALFQPLDLALPFALGLVADGVGLVAALAFLGAQPLGLAALAALEARRCRAPAP